METLVGHDTLSFEQESNPMNLELENKSTYKNNIKKNTKNVDPKSNWKGTWIHYLESWFEID